MRPALSLPRPRRVVLALAALLTALVLGWALIAFSEIVSRATEDAPAPTMEMYLGDREANPEYNIPEGVQPIFVPFDEEYEVYLHVDLERTPGALFVKRFTLEDASPEIPLAAHFALSRTIFKVQINGSTLYANTQRNAWTGNQGFAPVAFLIPNDLLRAGENELSFVQSGVSRKIAPVVTIGEAPGIMRAVWWSDLFSSLLPSISVALLVFVAMLFVVVRWPQRDRARVVGIVALLLAWALYNLNVLGFPTGVGNPWRGVIGYITPFLLVTGFTLSVLTKVGARWYFLAATGLFGAGAMAGVVFFAFEGSQAVFEFGWPIEVWSKMILAPVLVALLAWDIMHSREADHVQFIAYTTCLMALFIDGADDRFGVVLPLLPDLSLSFYATPWFALVFALGMCASIATQASRARQIAVAHSDILEQRLAEQGRELEVAFAREKDIARERALIEERQRLMRDMHDGIGGQLVSLILQSRSGHVQLPEISKSLTDALEDLRLIVDSLDTAGDTLGYALGAFRARFEPKLRESSIECHWTIDPVAAERSFGPEANLAVLRILQEACSNAIQHSGARSLSIALRRAGNGAAVLTVEDDGSGFDPDAAYGTGRGLRSMSARAARLGASLDLEPRPQGGTRVRLELPSEETAPLETRAAV